ncbi:hypothetical protein ABK040_014336 [Willaertia magna]
METRYISSFSSMQRFLNACFIFVMCLDYIISGIGFSYFTENSIQSMIAFETETTQTTTSTLIIGSKSILHLLLKQLGYIYILFGILGFYSLLKPNGRSTLLFILSSVVSITTITKMHYILTNNPFESLSNEQQEIMKFEMVRLVIGLLVLFIGFVEGRAERRAASQPATTTTTNSNRQQQQLDHRKND